MRSDHRHELKTNELADWIMNLPEWAQENRNTLIAAGAVIVVAAVVYFGVFHRRDALQARNQTYLTTLVAQVPQKISQVASAAQQNRDDSYILVQTEQDLQDFADKSSNNNMAALALIQRGAALRAEVHYRPTEISHDDLVTQLGKAQASYQQALDRKPSSPSLAAAAQYGLGLCEEELGNFDKAAALYGEVAQKPEYAGTDAQAAAAYRLKVMGDFKTPVVFEPAPPKPAPAPTPQASTPTIQIKPSTGGAATVVPVTPATQGTTIVPTAPAAPTAAPTPDTTAAPAAPATPSTTPAPAAPTSDTKPAAAPAPAPQPTAPAPAPSKPDANAPKGN
jgi:type II secretory pathway component PulM